MRELTKYSIEELSRLISRKEVSAAEVTQGYLDKIREKDGLIGAYITVTEEAALKKPRVPPKCWRILCRAIPPLRWSGLRKWTM